MFHYTSKCKSGLELLSLCVLLILCFSIEVLPVFPSCSVFWWKSEESTNETLPDHLRMFPEAGWTSARCFSQSCVTNSTFSVTWHQLCCFSLTCAVPVQFIIQGKAFGHRGGALVDLRGSSKLINFPGVFFLNGRIPCSCLKGKDVTAWFQFGSTSPYFSFVLENSLDFCISLGIF